MTRSPSRTCLLSSATCRRRLAIVSMLIGLPGIIAIVGLFGFRINLTPSEPIGLWRIAELDRPAAVGDLVFLCPPQTPAMRQARKRGYLRAGRCPGGFAPLIKSVVAVAGQHVEVRGSSIGIDGILLDSSRPLKFDGRGRSLTPYRGGTVPAGAVFVHSSFGASFDSRYFGPVPASGILGLAIQVVTYAP